MNAMNKGDALEYRGFRLLQKYGYLVRRNYSISTSAGLHQITDVDILGLKYEVGFTKKVFIIECKNRKRTVPIDRILWLRGLKEIIGAQLASLIVPNVKWDIKDYGYKRGIKVIDFVNFDSLETALNVDKSEFFGLGDYRYYEPLYSQWQSMLSSQNRLHITYNFLSTEARNINPYKGINRLFSEMQWLMSSLDGSNKARSDFSLFLLYEIVILMAVYLLQICEYCQILNQSERQEYLNKSLTYVDWNKEKAENLLLSSWKVAARLSKEQLGKEIQIPKEFNTFPRPEFTDGIIEVVERFCKYPNSSIHVIEFLDMLLYEYLFKQKQIDDTWLKSFFDFGNHYDMTLKQAKKCN